MRKDTDRVEVWPTDQFLQLLTTQEPIFKRFSVCKPHFVSCHCWFKQPSYKEREVLGTIAIHSFTHSLCKSLKERLGPCWLCMCPRQPCSGTRAGGRLPTEAHLVSGGRQERRRWGQTRLQPGWRRRCGRGGRQFPSRCCRTRRRSG